MLATSWTYLWSTKFAAAINQQHTFYSIRDFFCRLKFCDWPYILHHNTKMSHYSINQFNRYGVTWCWNQPSGGDNVCITLPLVPFLTCTVSPSHTIILQNVPCCVSSKARCRLVFYQFPHHSCCILGWIWIPNDRKMTLLSSMTTPFNQVCLSLTNTVIWWIGWHIELNILYKLLLSVIYIIPWELTATQDGYDFPVDFKLVFTFTI